MNQADGVGLAVVLCALLGFAAYIRATEPEEPTLAGTDRALETCLEMERVTRETLSICRAQLMVCGDLKGVGYDEL